MRMCNSIDAFLYLENMNRRVQCVQNERVKPNGVLISLCIFSVSPQIRLQIKLPCYAI